MVMVRLSTTETKARGGRMSNPGAKDPEFSVLHTLVQEKLVYTVNKSGYHNNKTSFIYNN